MSAAPHARSASHALPNRGGSRGFFGCPRNGGHSCASGYIQEAGGAVPDNEGGTSRYSLCVCDVCILRGGVQCQQRYFLGFGDIMHIDIVKAYIYDSLRWFIWKKESSGSPSRRVRGVVFVVVVGVLAPRKQHSTRHHAPDRLEFFSLPN